MSRPIDPGCRAVDDPSGRADPDEVARIASERLAKARMQILLDHPHLASALLQVPIRASSAAVLEVAIATDGRRIVYRPEAIASRSTPEVALLVQHVLLHVILMHADRGRDRDWRVWEVACDLAVNAILRRSGLELPRGWASNPGFDSMSAEQIYDAIAPNGLAPSDAGQGSIGDAMFPPPAEVASPASAGASVHSMAFERAAEGLAGLSELEVRHLGAAFRSALESTAWGHRPGDAADEIDAALRERFDWRRILARFIQHGLDRSASTLRPNRKHLWRGIWLAGTSSQGMGRIAVAIDTSGSMDRERLAAVLGEIDAIRRCGADELTVVQFDASIQGVAEYAPWQEVDVRLGSTRSMSMFGRGGTDLRQPFEWAERERAVGRAPTVLIVCTDGFGPLPSGPRGWLPVLFMLTEKHGRIPEELGAQLVLDSRSIGAGYAPGTTR